MMNATLLLSLALGGAGQAATDADSQAKLTTAWLRVCLEHASAFRIHPTGNPSEVFEILPSPLIRHAQPARGAGVDTGAVWMWVQKNGRPGAIGLFHAFPGRTGDARNRFTKHVFHSLSEVPLTAIWQGRTRWSPDKGGLQWKPIPDAPAPAESLQQRLRQIRALARPVKAHSIDTTGGRWELRLLPRPLYNYDKADDGSSLGGAVLGICQGIDVEIVLCIDARQTDDGYRWHYAFAPFSDYRLHAQLGEAEAWSIDGSRGSRRGTRDPFWRSSSVKTKLPEKYLENNP